MIRNEATVRVLAEFDFGRVRAWASRIECRSEGQGRGVGSDESWDECFLFLICSLGSD
jgi:hypothetical protein